MFSTNLIYTDFDSLRALKKEESREKAWKEKDKIKGGFCFPLMPQLVCTFCQNGEGAGWPIAKKREENFGFCLLPATHTQVGIF